MTIAPTELKNDLLTKALNYREKTSKKKDIDDVLEIVDESIKITDNNKEYMLDEDFKELKTEILDSNLDLFDILDLKPKDEIKKKLTVGASKNKKPTKSSKKSKPIDKGYGFWEKIINSVGIQDIYPKTLSLELTNNRYYRGACALHPNTSGDSFRYFPDTKSWNCFSLTCGTGGTVIDLYAHINNMDYKDAMFELAKQYKIPFDEFDKEKFDTIIEIEKIYEDYAKKCHENLKKSKYYEIEKQKRRFTDDTMTFYSVGLVDRAIQKYMESTYSEDLLIKAGFINEKGYGHWICGKRIVYPYPNRKIEPKFFIHRGINAEPDYRKDKKGKLIKYVKLIKTEYSIEIPFGLYSINNHLDKPLLIVEGITDAMSVRQEKYSHISPVTIHFKDTELEILPNYCKGFEKTIIIFDNEENGAGLKGAEKTLKVLLKNGINGYIGIIPDKYINKSIKDWKIDVDEFLRDNSLEEFEQIINDATSGFNYLLNTINEQSSQDDIIEILEILPENDFITQEDVFKKLAKKRKTTLKSIRDTHKKYQDEKNFKEKKKQEREQGELRNGAYEQPERILANLVLDNFAFLNTLRNTEEFCLNIDGVYIRGKITETIIREFLTETSRGFMYISPDREVKEYVETPSRRSMIYEFIKTKSFIDFSKFDYFENKFSILNGVLEFNEENFEWIFTNHKDLKEPLKTFVQFPIYYEPNADCPKIEQLLIDIFDEERLKLIYDELAYLLMPTIKYGKSFFHYGETHTAKTTYSNIINQFIGKESHGKKQIREIPLHRLTERFQMPNLIGAVLNKCDDQPDNAITNITIFRKICTNKSLEEEIKNVQERVQWNNRTKLISLSNKLTPNKNFIDADYRRIVLIEHYNQFIGKEKEPKMRDKIYSQKELSGLLNKCLKAWIRIEKRKGFSLEWDNIDYVKSIFQIEKNPVAPFIEDCCKINPLFSVDYDLFFKAINIYLTEKSLQPIAKGIITRRLKEINKNYRKITVSTKTHINSSGYKYGGLTIKKNWLEKHSDKISEKKANLSEFLE